jgi:tRNA modification GTPase
LVQSSSNWREELRQAADILGRLTGATDVEEMLGAIFSTFCIGK